MKNLPDESQDGYENPYHSSPFADRDLAQLVALAARLAGRFRPEDEQERRARPNWFTVAFAAVPMFIQVVVFVWLGGRMSQRLDTLEIQSDQQRTEIATSATVNAQQGAALGVIAQQYIEIGRRLDNLDNAKERRR